MVSRAIESPNLKLPILGGGGSLLVALFLFMLETPSLNQQLSQHCHHPAAAGNRVSIEPPEMVSMAA